MGSFSGKCEIVEEEEDEQNLEVNKTGRTNPSGPGSNIIGDKDLESPVLKLGYKGSLEDDINQLFESISIRTSSMLPSYQVGPTSSRNTSTLQRNAMKKPRVPITEAAEPKNLKQAVRDLCFSRASETAAASAMKQVRSPRGSEAGIRTNNIYGSVLIEPGSESRAPNDGEKSVLIEILDGDDKGSSSESISKQLHLLTMNSSSQSIETSQGSSVQTRSHGNQEPETEISSRDKSLSDSSERKTVVGLKSTRRVRLLYANTPTSTIVNGRRLPKFTRTAPRVPKPTLKNKVSAKKKMKHETCVAKVYDEFDGFYDPFTKELLCHRCHYALKNTDKEASCNNLSRNDEFESDVLDPNAEISCVDEEGKDFPRSSYETSCEISANAETDLDDVMNSRAGINQVSLASVLVSNDTEVCVTKNISKETSLSENTLFMSDHSVEIGSFSEKSVVVNPDSPPDQYRSYGETAIEEEEEEESGNLATISSKGEFFKSSKDSIDYSSGSTSISEEEHEINRSSFGNRPHMSKDVRWEAIQHIRAQHGSLGLRHFNLLKKLGCGDIGTVYLAELTGTNCLFAIKVMDNEFLETRNKMSRAQTEREILKMLDHPFLPTLYSHFTSDNLSCLLMECCPGGDLHVLRQKQPRRCFPEPAARFYVAEVLLALEYLHMLGVIYRDLKPENILVREDGHIMVTDFDLSLRCQVSPTLLESSYGTAVRLSGNGSESNCIEPLCFRPRLSTRAKKGKKQMRKLKKSDILARFRQLPQLVAEPTDARSNSFVGTHEYLAPEIIKGEGHGAAVDWWTFGIFLYELLYGRTPFKGSTNEETLANVVLQNLKFPDNPNVSFPAKDLIRSLLVKEPENRLGAEKGAADIKRHVFFQGLNWALIRCAIPPELPELCEYGVESHHGKSNYLECKATGEHLEFQLF